MGKHGTLYQHLADAIRAHSGDPAELIAAVCDLVSDEVAAEVGDRLDEELHQIDAAIGASERPVPAPEGRRGHTESEAAQRWCEVRIGELLGPGGEAMSMPHDQRGEDGSGLMKNCAMTILAILALIGAGVIFFFEACAIIRSADHTR